MKEKGRGKWGQEEKMERVGEAEEEGEPGGVQVKCFRILTSEFFMVKMFFLYNTYCLIHAKSR